jgi:hypothetical protein
MPPAEQDAKRAVEAVTAVRQRRSDADVSYHFPTATASPAMHLVQKE